MPQPSSDHHRQLTIAPDNLIGAAQGPKSLKNRSSAAPRKFPHDAKSTDGSRSAKHRYPQANRRRLKFCWNMWLFHTENCWNSEKYQLLSWWNFSKKSWAMLGSSGKCTKCTKQLCNLLLNNPNCNPHQHWNLRQGASRAMAKYIRACVRRGLMLPQLLWFHITIPWHQWRSKQSNCLSIRVFPHSPLIISGNTKCCWLGMVNSGYLLLIMLKHA